EARGECFAYSINPGITHEDRVGNFWKDLFRFNRKIKNFGWNFKGLIVIVGEVVVYKERAGGKPHFETLREEKNPLGPVQNLGDLTIEGAKKYGRQKPLIFIRGF
ncbi:MAG: hypothetical protein K9M15_02625, partial [Candidatus Marinimicrobia bacterium]|nr:hypothetical protein [Candidatus Neomarinimicrobiota bacterium]